jgi:hypothetical protein
MPQWLYDWGESPCYWLDMKLGGTQSWSECVEPWSPTIQPSHCNEISQPYQKLKFSLTPNLLVWFIYAGTLLCSWWNTYELPQNNVIFNALKLGCNEVYSLIGALEVGCWVAVVASFPLREKLLLNHQIQWPTLCIYIYIYTVSAL